MQSTSTYFAKTANSEFADSFRNVVADNFRAMLDSTLTIETSMGPEEQKEVAAYFPIEVMWVPAKKATVQPHMKLAAMRAGMRKIWDQHEANFRGLKTLCLGATMQEVDKHKSNSNMHFSMHGSEPKDDMRISSKMSADIANVAQKAAAKYPQLVEGRNIDISLSTEELVDLYSAMNDMEGRIKTRTEETGAQFECLRAEDAHYNLGWEEYYQLMKKTGANRFSLMGMWPAELIKAEHPKSRLYRFEKEGSRSRMTDERGYANGYTHETEKWGCLLNKPAYAGADFNIVSEIKVRVGPFCIIELSRTYNGGLITRDVTLFAEPYVSILDIMQDLRTPVSLANFVMRKKVDFSKRLLIPREEFMAAKEYISSLKDLSVDFEVLQSFIRRRRGGAAFVDRMMVKQWDSQPEDHRSLVAVLVNITYAERGKMRKAEKGIFSESMVKRFFRGLLDGIEIPEVVWSLFLADENFLQKLAYPVDPVLVQNVELPGRSMRATERRHQVTVSSRVVRPVTEELKAPCVVCDMFPWLDPKDKSDLQVMICGHPTAELKRHVFAMTQEEVDAFRLALLPLDDDPVELANVKKAAREKCPKVAFRKEVEYVVVDGAPGTGKSTVVRKMITKRDAVWAPFRDLMDDYKVDRFGDKITFKTNHRIISCTEPLHTVFIDEARSLPYEYVAVGALNSNVQRFVIFSGCHQTETLPSEGIPLSSKICMKRDHYLLKNFRNSMACIRWMRECQGFDVEAAGPEFNDENEPLYRIVEGIDADPQLFDKVISPDRLSVEEGVSDSTIRGSQGRTFHSLLKICPRALNTFAQPCLTLVGLTRDRKAQCIELVEGAERTVVGGIIGRVVRGKQMRPQKVDPSKLYRTMRLLLSKLNEMDYALVKGAMVANGYEDDTLNVIDAAIAKKQEEKAKEPVVAEMVAVVESFDAPPAYASGSCAVSIGKSEKVCPSEDSLFGDDDVEQLEPVEPEIRQEMEEVQPSQGPAVSLTWVKKGGLFAPQMNYTAPVEESAEPGEAEEVVEPEVETESVETEADEAPVPEMEEVAQGISSYDAYGDIMAGHKIEEVLAHVPEMRRPAILAAVTEYVDREETEQIVFAVEKTEAGNMSIAEAKTSLPEACVDTYMDVMRERIFDKEVKNAFGDRASEEEEWSDLASAISDEDMAEEEEEGGFKDEPNDSEIEDAPDEESILEELDDIMSFM